MLKTRGQELDSETQTGKVLSKCNYTDTGQPRTAFHAQDEGMCAKTRKVP